MGFVPSRWSRRLGWYQVGSMTLGARQKNDGIGGEVFLLNPYLPVCVVQQPNKLHWNVNVIVDSTREQRVYNHVIQSKLC